MAKNDGNSFWKSGEAGHGGGLPPRGLRGRGAAGDLLVAPLSSYKSLLMRTIDEILGSISAETPDQPSDIPTVTL